jgi:hypothetical protein
MEPLWPYKFININDTKFVKNGSFGSDVPFFADKVKKFQTYKTIIKDDLGNKVSPNNETYLCSWLYKKDHESEPIWLDRYYYPDMIERHEALKGESNFKQSFENIIDKNYIKNENINYDDTVTGKIYRNTFFDKLSDMVIEAGNTYRYQRISTDMVNEVIN